MEHKQEEKEELSAPPRVENRSSPVRPPRWRGGGRQAGVGQNKLSRANFGQSSGLLLSHSGAEGEVLVAVGFLNHHHPSATMRLERMGYGGSGIGAGGG